MNATADRLFRARFGMPPEERRLLAGAGGRRRMLRLGAGGQTAVAVLGPDAKENRAFLAYTAVFRELGLPVPEVYGTAEDDGVYLLQDLGDTTLFGALTADRGAGGGRVAGSILATYREVLTWLPHFQVEGGRAIDYAVAHPRADFDRRAMLWDLSYFKYHFLMLAHVDFDEDRLQTDFERLVDRLLDTDGSHFVYRDFQSRNVMLVDGAPYFIDYQGGRRGALAYDVASLLYDGKAALPEAVREELLAHYLDALEAHVPVDREQFLGDFGAYVVLRILQAMGAYGYRGMYERKAHFLASVPPAIDNVEILLDTVMPGLALPELSAVFERLCADEGLRRPAPAVVAERFTIRIASFSYKRGIPDDPGGHGGGYVFDCRGLPNPGREARYAERTGLDAAVVQYLEADRAVGSFYERVRALVESHAAAFDARGFTSLRVLFGCTGGQHRSVYMAARLGRELAARFPTASVEVEHVQSRAWPRPETT